LRHSGKCWITRVGIIVLPWRAWAQDNAPWINQAHKPTGPVKHLHWG
jgi:hypothetical protein